MNWIKTKITSAWNWLKAKVRRFKKWLIGALVASAAVGSLGLVSEDPVEPLVEEEIRTELLAIDDLEERIKRKVEIIFEKLPSQVSFTKGMEYVVSEIKRENKSIHALVVAKKDGVAVYDDYIRVVNPPVLVRDGTTTADVLNDRTDEVEQRTVPAYREDPVQAYQNVISDTVETTLQRKGGTHLPKNKGTTTTVFSTTADGQNIAEDFSAWANVQEGTNADNFFTDTAGASEQFAIDASQYAVGNYFISVFYFDFDTSDVGSDTIDDVTFSLVSNGLDGGDRTGNLELRALDWGGTLTTADWVDFRTATNWTNLTLCAELAHSSWTATGGTRNDFPEQAGFAGEIVTDGVTYVAVAHSNAYGSEPATADYSTGIYAADQAGTDDDPRLVINHTASVGAETKSINSQIIIEN